MIGAAAPDRPALSPALSVVIRAHDPDQIDRLAMAVLSVWAQSTEDPVELILATSGAWPRLTAEMLLERVLRGAGGRFAPAGPRSLRHLPHDIRGDSRVALLQSGLVAASADLVAVLDHDDVWRADAAVRLVACARETGAAVVFGACDLALVPPGAAQPDQMIPYHSFPFRKIDLLRHNVAPFNSYVMRTLPARAAAAAMPRLGLFEDYYILLKVLAEGEAAWLETPWAVSEYRIDLGRQASKYRDQAATEAWAEIETLRRGLAFALRGSDIAEDPVPAISLAAQRELILALPELPSAALAGKVESILPVPGGHLVTGWCLRLEEGDPQVNGLYVEDERGNFHLATTRWERPEVLRRYGGATCRPGFAAVLQHRPRAVFAIHDRARVRLG